MVGVTVLTAAKDRFEKKNIISIAFDRTAPLILIPNTAAGLQRGYKKTEKIPRGTTINQTRGTIRQLAKMPTREIWLK